MEAAMKAVKEAVKEAVVFEKGVISLRIEFTPNGCEITDIECKGSYKGNSIDYSKFKSYDSLPHAYALVVLYTSEKQGREVFKENQSVNDMLGDVKGYWLEYIEDNDFSVERMNEDYLLKLNKKNKLKALKANKQDLTA